MPAPLPPPRGRIVTVLLRDVGWSSIHDLGDITNARGTEQLLALWIRLYGLFGTTRFNFRVVKGSPR